MVFGILEPQLGSAAPGTVLLEDLQQGAKSAAVILFPQPTASPKDPLNFSRTRKELYFLTLLFGACATGALGPVLVPGFSIIASSFQVSLASVTLLNGSLIMGLGVGSYFCAPLAETCGRRLVYLCTTILLVVSCIWAAEATTYRLLLATRVFQGLGMGSFYSLAGTISINDVFFIHERGLRVGLWNFAVIASVNITPIVSGYLIVDLGWRWSFWVLAITFGVCLGFVLLCLPETIFKRDFNGHLSTVEAARSSAEEEESKATTTVNQEKDVTGSDSYSQCDGVVSGEVSAWRRVLGVEAVAFKDISTLMRLVFRPLGLLCHPAVVWGCCMWSVLFTWNIIQGAVADQIFASPPYNLSPTDVGLIIGIPPFIGAVLGTIGGGWLCDYVAKFLAVRSAGIFEPEFRLLVMLLSFIPLAIGAFGVGIAVTNGLSTIKCGVFLALLNIGSGMGCTVVVAYTNDVCSDRAGEALGLSMLVKSAFAFGLSFMFNDYLAKHGAVVFFSTWGGLSLGIMLTTIPLYIFGKRIRAKMSI